MSLRQSRPESELLGWRKNSGSRHAAGPDRPQSHYRQGREGDRAATSLLVERNGEVKAMLTGDARWNCGKALEVVKASSPTAP